MNLTEKRDIYHKINRNTRNNKIKPSETNDRKLDINGKFESKTKTA